jgi:hypothetical protein
MEIPQARVVRNPRPIDTEDAFDKILRQISMLANKLVAGKFNWDLGARSRRSRSCSFGPVKILTKFFQRSLSRIRTSRHARPINYVSCPRKRFHSRCIRNLRNRSKPNANRVVVHRPVAFEHRSEEHPHRSGLPSNVSETGHDVFIPRRRKHLTSRTIETRPIAGNSRVHAGGAQEKCLQRETGTLVFVGIKSLEARRL